MLNAMINIYEYNKTHSDEVSIDHSAVTLYYDEFAQYLPEFGRLKELSKMSVLMRYLNGIRQSNQESLEAIDAILKVVILYESWILPCRHLRVLLKN